MQAELLNLAAEYIMSSVAIESQEPGYGARR
jgi:hypothetical protein